MNRPTAMRRRVLPGDNGAGWEAAALRIMSWVACPALAGAAFALLCLGVVTWLPAWAAAAHSLHRWRTEADSRCFVGTFAAFPHYWRGLFAHSCAATVVGVVLAGNVAFLASRHGPAALALLAVQVGIALALVTYHLSLAVVAGLDRAGDAARWRRAAAVLAFGSWRSGLLLVISAVGAPLLSLPIPLGPIVLGPTLPLLVGLMAARRLGGPSSPANE